jgi:RNA polymerase sigma factor (sigma-70 family)
MDCNTREERALRLARAVKLVLAGDVNAYEDIYAVCNRALHAFLCRRYGHLGDDFVQEVAIRTHEYTLTRLDKYDSDKGTSFQTWVNWQSRSVASQVMAERYGPQLARFNVMEHEVWAGSVAGPADILEGERRSRVLRQEFRALAEDDRLSIAHHDLAGRTFAETAQRTDATVSKTRWVRHRGLARLRTRLLELGIRPVEVDSTPVPIWYGSDSTEGDDDYTASVTAVLPDGPDTLVGAAARDAAEEEDEG